MDMSRFFEYRITYWDSIDDELITCYGVTYANNLMDATKNICDSYVEDSIESIQLFPLFPVPVYEFDDEMNYFN